MKPAAVGLAAAVVLGAAVAVVVGTHLVGDGGRVCPAFDPPGVAGAGPAVVPESTGSGPAAYTVEVVDRTPHDETAFTQGLIHAGGLLYEGTGLYGESLIRSVEPDTGDVLAEEAVDESEFGEGVAGRTRRPALPAHLAGGTGARP